MTRRQEAVHPLEELGLRPTDLTLRVLEAIGNWTPANLTPAHPGPGVGPSSRELAKRAGIKHESQMSRLLTRLEAVGLVEVTSRSRHRPGGPYAWSLTPKGKEVQRAIEAHGDSWLSRS
jgi:DNA-binding MarR family transcriptional regulator